MWFGLAFLAALLALYLFYFFTEIAFILPATFILFARRGIWDRRRQSRDARGVRTRSRKTSRDNAIIAGVIALDLMLAISMVAETSDRVAASPAQSKMVPYAGRDRRATATECDRDQQHLACSFWNSTRHAEDRTDRTQCVRSGRSVHRLSSRAAVHEKSRRMAGSGAARCFLAARTSMMAKRKRSPTRFAPAVPRIFLMTAPERQDYADLLKDEVAQVSASFNLDAVRAIRYGRLLSPHASLAASFGPPHRPRAKA